MQLHPKSSAVAL